MLVFVDWHILLNKGLLEQGTRREGIIFSEKTTVLRRWNEHFDNLITSDDGDYEALTGSMKIQKQGVVEPPSLEELIEAINKLKANKTLFPLSY
ncbi:hypothetical protein TNCV_1759131 [Trichonephila clavipes]|nr:hypothetical protein TNCV_1759131 [Trichonephila clavipes]